MFLTISVVVENSSDPVEMFTLKFNAVGYDPCVYTDPEVLGQTILYFQKNGARNIYVIENCSQGNFTRLVFDVIGYIKICKETGAIPVSSTKPHRCRSSWKASSSSSIFLHLSLKD